METGTSEYSMEGGDRNGDRNTFIKGRGDANLPVPITLPAWVVFVLPTTLVLMGWVGVWIWNILQFDIPGTLCPNTLSKAIADYPPIKDASVVMFTVYSIQVLIHMVAVGFDELRDPMALPYFKHAVRGMWGSPTGERYERTPHRWYSVWTATFVVGSLLTSVTLFFVLFFDTENFRTAHVTFTGLLVGGQTMVVLGATARRLVVWNSAWKGELIRRYGKEDHLVRWAFVHLFFVLGLDVALIVLFSTGDPCSSVIELCLGVFFLSHPYWYLLGVHNAYLTMDRPHQDVTGAVRGYLGT